MKKVLKNRVLPFVCAFSILISLCVVPSVAVEVFPDGFRDYDSVADWEAQLLNSDASFVTFVASKLNCPATGQEVFWKLVTGQLGNNLGCVDDIDDLYSMASAFDDFFNKGPSESFLGQFISGSQEFFNDSIAKLLIGSWEPEFSVEQHPSSGLWRLYENTTGIFVVDSAGRYPYAEASMGEDIINNGNWVPISYLNGKVEMLSFDALNNIGNRYDLKPFHYGAYWVLKKTGDGLVQQVLANSDGYPYVARYNPNEWATNQDRPQTEVKNENGEVVEDMLEGLVPGINLDNMTVTLPDGSINFIDNLIYDESTKSYTIDSHDTNLSLVLPDSAVPVADEYWSITSSGENLFDYDIASGTAPGFIGVSNRETVGSDSSYYTDYVLDQASTEFAFPKWGLNSRKTSAAYSDGFFTLTSSSGALQSGFTSYYGSGGISSSDAYWTGEALSTMISYTDLEYGNVSRSQFMPDGDYVLSVALGDGTVCSYPFTVSGGAASATSVSFDSLTIGVYRLASYWSSRSLWVKNVGYYLYILPANGVPVDIRYIELIKGTETDLKAEFVSSIVPIDKDSLHTPTLAVRTDEEITSHIIGGPRPSLPEKGMVWALVENERITSIQIYNGQAWEPCDGRIWTGERWVPASAYNVITLQDMYDIADATPDFEYIYSESGFWTWWQKSWNAFTERLFKALESGTGTGSGGTTVNPDTAPSIPDDPDSGKEGYTILELFVVLKDGTWEMISGVVSTAYDGFSGFVQTVSDAGSFFDFYDDDSEDSIFFIPLEEGETIWD